MVSLHELKRDHEVVWRAKSAGEGVRDATIPIYTHARQFPHLAGKSDDEIRVIVRDAMAARPHLVRRMQRRNTTVIGGLLIAIGLSLLLTTLGLGASMLIAGAVATLFLLCWNFVWVNWVLFEITKPANNGPG